MAVTIKQIAELAGVSRGTVDRALNSRGGVNKEIEKKIKDIAKDLNYEPNPVAKALANSKRKVHIGVLINAGGNSFYDKVLIGMHRAIKEISGYNVNVTIEEMTGYDADLQLAMIEKLLENPLNGLVITPINDSKIVAKLNALAQAGIAITTLNADLKGLNKLCFVGCDYVKNGKTAAEILGQISNGELSVGIVTGSYKMVGHNERINGFKQVLAKGYPNISVASIVQNNDDDEQSYQVTKQLLEEQSVNALYFCAGGIDGGIKAIMEKGLEDIKIIAVDDTDNIKSYVKSGVINATVCQQPIKQGYDAIMAQYHFLVNGKKPQKKHLVTQTEVKLKYNLE